MILDFEKDSLPEESPFVVIGGGAVGLVLAVSLARKGKRVLVLETGGRTFDAATQNLNTPVIEGRSHLGVTEGRARILGGTTTLWGGQLVAFDTIDMAPRPWLGLEGWPIERADLDPFYSATAQLLGLDSISSTDDKVWAELGSTRPAIDDQFSVILTRWLKEPNLARYFSRELESSNNITIALHAHCVDFNFSEDGTTIESLVVKSPSERQAVIRANKVVLSNGTIEASRLMLSTAHGRSPWRANKWLGRGFQDHLDARAAKVEILNQYRFHDAFNNIVKRGYKYQPKLLSSHKFQEKHRTTNLAASFVADSAISEHIEKLKIAIRSIMRGSKPENFRDIFKSFTGTVKVWGPLILRYIRDSRVMQIADRGLFLTLHCEQIPLADSRVKLASDKLDAYSVPVVALDWRVDGRELKAMRHFVEELAVALETQGIARLAIDPRLAAEDPAFLDSCRDTNHHCGGLRMSKFAVDGVTDINLKVHECTNLYVAGAAVFPSSSFANPTFTAMALALRLADHLSE